MISGTMPPYTTQDVVADLRQQVQTLGEGAKLPTVRALMKRYGVGQGIIRQAVALLEREGAVRAEVGRGTFVRRPSGLHPAAQRSVIILNHERPGLRRELIAARIHEQLLAGGARSVLMTYSDLAHAGDWVRAMPSVDACILLPQTDLLPAGILATLKSRCRAVVIEGYPIEHLDVDAVATDWLLAIELAVGHLRGQGHTRIGLLLNDNRNRYTRDGARFFGSLSRLAGMDHCPVVYRDDNGNLDPHALEGCTAVIAWSADATAALRAAGASGAPAAARPIVAIENPDLDHPALAGIPVVGRSTARIAAAVIDRMDHRLTHGDAPFIPLYDPPQLVI